MNKSNFFKLFLRNKAGKMSFLGLLAILSLVVVIPVIFVWRAKRTTKNETPKAVETTIHLDKLPHLFQQIIYDIEAQFAQIEQKNQVNLLANENYFVAKQLFFVRLPQMLQDYLHLEPNYAKNHIVDKQNHLTSYAILQQQLKSILNIFYQINQSSNQKNLQNILVNQRYLQSVAEQTGSQNITLTQNIQQPISTSIYDSDYDTGREYLLKYIQNIEQIFSRKLVQKLGEMLYFASITQMAVREQFAQEFDKMAIQSNLELQNISHFLAYQLPMILQHQANLGANHYQDFNEKMLMVIDKILVIFSQILATLDTDFNMADKLALVQNYHDDFNQIIADNFSDF